MTFQEIQELIKLVGETELAEFKLKDGEFQLHIRGKGYIDPDVANAVVASTPTVMAAPSVAPNIVAAPAAAPAPAAPAAAASSAGSGQTADADTSNYLEVKSPMVGTFYRSSSPDKPPYVKVGDSVAEGDTVCIVEAMKLFNEIESEVSGKIMKVMIEDAQPVEYDQVLFLVDPKG